MHRLKPHYTLQQILCHTQLHTHLMDAKKALEKIGTAGILSVGSADDIEQLSVTLRDDKWQKDVGKVIPEICEIFNSDVNSIDATIVISYLRILGNCVSDNEPNRAALLAVWEQQKSFRTYLSVLVKAQKATIIPFFSAVLFNWANGDDDAVKTALITCPELVLGLEQLFQALSVHDFVSVGTLLTMLEGWVLTRHNLDIRVTMAIYRYLLSHQDDDSNVAASTEALLVMVNSEEAAREIDFSQLLKLVQNLSEANPDDLLMSPLDLRRALYTSLVCSSEEITLKDLDLVSELRHLKFWDAQLSGIGPSCWIAVTSTLIRNENDLGVVLSHSPALIQESLFLLQTAQYSDQLQSGGHFLKLATNKSSYCQELLSSPLLKEALTNLLSFPYIPELRLLGAQILLNVVKNVSAKANTSGNSKITEISETSQDSGTLQKTDSSQNSLDTDKLLKTVGLQFYKSEQDGTIKSILQTALSYCKDMDRDILDHVIDGLAGPISPRTMRLTTVVGIHASKLDESQKKKVLQFLLNCAKLDKSEEVNKGVRNNAAYICKVGGFGDELLKELIN